jgi:hypothetical protein
MGWDLSRTMKRSAGGLFKPRSHTPRSTLGHRRLLCERLEVRELLSVSPQIDWPPYLGGWDNTPATTTTDAEGHYQLDLPTGTGDSDWHQQAQLTASDGAGGDRFGAGSINGNYAIVGAHTHDSLRGAAYVYEQSGESWSEVKELIASDGEAGDAFGLHTSISGDYAVVGAYSDDDKGTDSGSAYIFYRDPVNGWAQQAKLTASNGASYNYFGAPVKINGDYVVIGAHGRDSYRGAAYVFHRTGTTWTEYALPIPDDVPAGARFGHGVAIDGEYVVVGAFNANSGRGAAYVYRRNGSSWDRVATLTASDGSAGDAFAQRVAISGESVIVGAVGDDGNAGSVYVFKRPAAGWADMTETAKVTAPDRQPNDLFGGGVSISGDYALIAAAYDDNEKGPDAGSAFLLKLSDFSLHQLTASDGTGGDHFGAEVDISGNEALVGADLKNGWRGAAYVFTAHNNVAPEITDLINSAPEPGMGTPGEPVDVMAMFSDSDWFDAHTATIDWGDGSQSAGDVMEIGGVGSVSATHAYTSGGVYTITLTVSDDDGGTVSRTTNALITGVGIQNGVLHIVGTDGNDRVRVVPYRGRSLIVFASFLQGPGSPPYQIFPAAGIERIEAVLGDGDDFAAVAGTIKLTTILDGGAGNDRLAGGGGANALIGRDGNDFLVGGRGRDLLLGGEGMDYLVGNSREDILIGGSTNLETSENADGGAFDQALLSVLSEWNTEQPYLTRVGRIRSVIQADDDNARDLLFGGSGSDWFFAKSRGPNRDRIVGRTPREFVEELA